MANFTCIDSCRICGNTELVPVLSLGEQCLTGVFPASLDTPVTRGPLELVKCAGDRVCGLLQLRHTYDSCEMYGQSYGYRSSLNRSMVKHLHQKVRSLMIRTPLHPGDVVLDIGSNDGTTLSFYPESVRRIGVDPTAAKFAGYYAPGVDIVPEFFSAARFDTLFGGIKPKIITSIAMLYDLDDPLLFAREIESTLADDGIWHFEQSYMPMMLDTTGYDTICHEHVEYYDLSQIQWVMERAGLRILDVELNSVNGGSFAVTACKAGASLRHLDERVLALLGNEKARDYTTLRPFQEFATRVAKHRESLLELIATIRFRGEAVFGYGASTKGNVILQYCGLDDQSIPCIAEVNPDKFGSFTPGTGIPIVSEADAHAMKPDYFLAMPWHFRETILEREADYLREGGRLIFPLPRLEIVSTGIR